MDIEDLNQLEEPNIYSDMRRLMGEIADLISDEWKFFDQFVQNHRITQDVDENIGHKNQSIQERVNQVQELGFYIHQPPIYLFIYHLTRNPSLLQYRKEFFESVVLNPNTPQATNLPYKIEKLPNHEGRRHHRQEELELVYPAQPQWWMLRINIIVYTIKDDNNRTVTEIHKLRLMLTQQGEGEKKSEALELLNEWLNKLLFNAKIKWQIRENIKYIIDYVDESVQSIVNAEKCESCKRIYSRNSQGRLSHPVVRFVVLEKQMGMSRGPSEASRKVVYHENCLFG